MLRRIIATAGVFALAAGLGACSSSSEEKAGSGKANDASEVDVMTWWEAGSEKKGLDALVKVFNKQNPKTKFVNAAVAGGGGDKAKQKLQADLQSGNPPDTFQAHAGAELSDYIKAKQIEDVSKYYDEFKLKEAFPKELVDLLTVDGKIYSIPSNIHRANVVWANKSVLDKNGIDAANPPKDMDAWIADMKKLKEAGVVPITVGKDWTQLQLFETILIADLGVDGYNGLWTGKTKFEGEKAEKAIKHFTEIVNLADVNQSNDWEPAMKPVIEGKAAYNVMGDWAPAAFDAAQKKWGKDYVTFPVPGTAGVFDFLADSFTMPKGAKHPGGTVAWFKTISSKEGQIAFNTVKGSIPSRSDLSAEEIGKFSEYQQQAMKDYGKDKIAVSLAHGAAAPLKVSEQLKKVIVAFTQSKRGDADAKTFQTEFAKALEKK